MQKLLMMNSLLQMLILGFTALHPTFQEDIMDPEDPLLRGKEPPIVNKTDQMDTGSEGDHEKKTLSILGLFPMRGQWSGGRAMLPAVRLALEHINSRQDVLQDYKLDLVWGDTACDPGVGVDAMYHLLNLAPTKLMVLGAACSPVTETTARASHLWNLVQISYVSSSPALSNKKSFPKFFRVNAPEVALNPTKIGIMKYFGWTKVATIHESIQLFSLVTEDFVKRLPENNITLITSEIFTDDPTVQVENLKSHDARIIFAGAHYAALYRLMCAAYRAGLYGARYVWVLPGWYTDRWWTDDVYDDSTDCTAQQIAMVADGYISLGTTYINPKQVEGISGHTPAEWEAEMANKTAYPDLVGAYVAAQGYDSAWAVALALNFTETELRQRGIKYGLGNFTYENTDLAEIIYSNMWKVDFQGIKGHIYYDENGDCLDLVQIKRFQEDRVPVVAYHQADSHKGIEWLPDSPIIWKDGRPPKDSTRKLTRSLFVPETIYGAMVTIAALGISTAFLLLLFNVIFRKERLIKMSSPVLNNIILVGCVISYITVILQERNASTTYVFCKVRSVTVMVGFSLSFGALFAKTWRVYVIFTNKTKKTVLRDIQLVGIVAGLVFLDLVIITSQLILDPHWVVDTVVSTKEEDNGDVVIFETVSVCISALSTYFMATIYIYKGLLIIFGAFLAWQTRKVTIPALNDSKFIGMCIYNVVILSGVAVLLASVLDNQVTLKYVLVNALLMLGVFITQFTIFIPKIYKFWSIRTKIGDSSEAEQEETGTGLAPKTIHVITPTPGGPCQNLTCQKTIQTLKDELLDVKEQLNGARR